uniref:Poly [ADP-ribose] polymerase n=1 Tax=Syphacia muris TaxID=451379 RepID=A0A0N5AY30_9BILA
MVSKGYKSKNAKKTARKTQSRKQDVTRQSNSKPIRKSQRLLRKVKAVVTDVKKVSTSKISVTKRRIQRKSNVTKVSTNTKVRAKESTSLIIKVKGKSKRKCFEGKTFQSTTDAIFEGKKRRRKNDYLVPREDIPLYDTNPYFTGKNAPAFVSVRSFCRILHRYIYRKDLSDLIKCIKNKKQLCNDAFNWSFSYCSKLSVEERAILTDDIKFIGNVINLRTDFDEKRSLMEGRARMEEVLLTQTGTGRHNFYMLGRSTANIEMTRGGREGNNAFVKYEPHRLISSRLDVPFLFENDVSFGTLEFLTSLKRPPYSTLRDAYSSNIYVAIRFGNRKLAAKLIETYSSYNFNELHVQTLKNSTQPLKKFLPISVMKKAYRNRDITPLHTAAINPNVLYLKALMAVEANFNIADSDSWYTIHYAAVCEGPGPLKLILDKGIQYSLLNKAKELPLHCAARAGRVENVKLLLEAEKKVYKIMQSEEEDPDSLQSVMEADSEKETVAAKKKDCGANKRGPVTINAKTKDGHTPLHLAVEKNRLEVVDFLLSEENINVEAQLSASWQKITPLMVACQNGFLDVANMLIDKGGAIVEKVDKLRRTALTHAVINGEMHIVSMLLRRGASPTSADSSGNTPAHYAAAYGWLECLELLAKADPKVLEMSNDWQLTPLAVAYMKGHLGIVEWLIDGHFSSHVDINCRDSSGYTLIFSLINHYRILSTKNLYSQIEYLLAKGADCSLKDSCMNTPLHCFAALKVKLQTDNDEECSEVAEDNGQRLTVDEYKHCIDLLIKHGAKLNDKNQDGETVVLVALKACNLVAAEYFLNKYLSMGNSLCDLESKAASGSSSENLLHFLLKIPFKVYDNPEVWNRRYTPSLNQYNVIPLLNMLFDKDKNLCKQWLSERDKQGRTPFLAFCEQFSKVKPRVTSIEDSEERKNYSRFLEQLLSKTCEIIPLLVSILPSVLLQEYCDGEKVESDFTQSLDGKTSASNNKVEKISAIFYALHGNPIFDEVACRFAMGSNEYVIKNKLLTTCIDSAIDANILQEFLSTRNSDGYTPLLYSVSIADVSTSLYLMNKSTNCNVNEVHGAVVPTKFNEDKKLYEPLNKSVLMYAVENKLFEVIQNLKLTSEQWSAVSADGDTAFHFAARSVSPSTVACFQLLKEKGVLNKANNKMQYPLHIAVEASQRKGTDILTEPVEWLITNASALFEQDVDGRLPLHYAFVQIGDLSLKDSYSVDPICIVSVLQNAMDKTTIDHADKLGNTPLHYAALRGANVCTVTLLRCGCNPNCLNNNGNTPLAVAVMNAREACALTLIQAKSNVVSKVYIHYPFNANDEKDKWVWIPNRKSKRKSVDITTVSSLVVRNGWEGIIYVILDVIGKTAESLGDLVKAALEHNKYNLVQTLLRMLANVVNNATGEAQKRNLQFLDSLNLFLVFVQHLPSKSLSEGARKVFYQLCSLNIKWWSVSKEGCKPRSSVIEHLAKTGNYELMDLIYEYDKNNEKLWPEIEYSFDDTNPLLGIIENCSKRNEEVSEDAKKWIELFGNRFGINTLMPYKKPLFYGIAPWRYRKPVPEKCQMTALIKAIQSRCVPLVRFLLQSDALSTDCNVCDEHGLTPLMHACIVNSEDCIRLLFDPLWQCTSSETGMGDQDKTLGNLRKRKSDNDGNNGMECLFGGKRSRYQSQTETNTGDENGSNELNAKEDGNVIGSKQKAHLPNRRSRSEKKLDEKVVIYAFSIYFI